MTKKVAIYACVSTLDKGLDLSIQLLPSKKYAEARRRDIYKTYTDTMSGAKEKRLGFDAITYDLYKMLKDHESKMI